MDKIIIMGAGTMGAGIAAVAVAAGFAVDVIDPDQNAQQRAKSKIPQDVASRVNFYSAVPAGEAALLAVEAVPERLDLKRSVLRDLAATCGSDTLIATNTSSLSVDELAQGVPQPERVLGLHFFNPPGAMKLVEIVHGEQTSDDTIEAAKSIVERLGKTPVVTADTPGFIVNRVARPYYLQAMRAYDEGAAPVEDLDRLARGAGFRMGPFELMDLIGLDVNLATSESVYERTGAARLEPIALQRDMVAQNRLGRKTGAGFYDYASAPPAHDDELPQVSGERDAEERILVLGFAGLAVEMRELLAEHYEHVDTWENEDILDEIPLDTTIVIDTGDGVSDRSPIVGALDSLLPETTVIFADAYATDLTALAKRLQHPERLAGYGVLASLSNQRVVEIVDAETTGDDALELAQELFESMGRRVALIEDVPALFLGRVVASIVNEAVCAVEEGVASADDVDLAMRLGTNYPLGPIAWGREIGGDRVARILQRLAAAEGAAFGPHRALWVLDVDDSSQESEEIVPAATNIFPGDMLN